MSVQVQLLAVDDETREQIDDDVFQALSGGAMASMANALTGGGPSIEDEMEAVEKMETQIVGSSNHEYSSRVQDTLSGRQTVDQTLIAQVDALAELHPDASDSDGGHHVASHGDVIEFLDDHRGDTVFTVGA